MTLSKEESVSHHPSPLVPVTVPGSGLHIIANLRSEQAQLLGNSTAFQTYVDQLVTTYELRKLGQVYHDFPTGGYTAVVCLSESHLSVHTWPEIGYITFDIFLSNYQRNNQGTTRAIYDAVCSFFHASVIEEHFINR